MFGVICAISVWSRETDSYTVNRRIVGPWETLKEAQEAIDKYITFTEENWNSKLDCRSEKTGNFLKLIEYDSTVYGYGVEQKYSFDICSVEKNF